MRAGKPVTAFCPSAMTPVFSSTLYKVRAAALPGLEGRHRLGLKQRLDGVHAAAC